MVSRKVGQNIEIYRYIIVSCAKFEWIKHFVHFFVLSAHCASAPLTFFSPCLTYSPRGAPLITSSARRAIQIKLWLNLLDYNNRARYSFYLNYFINTFITDPITSTAHHKKLSQWWIVVSERYINTYTKLYYCASTFSFIILMSKVKSSVNLSICIVGWGEITRPGIILSYLLRLKVGLSGEMLFGGRSATKWARSSETLGRALGARYGARFKINTEHYRPSRYRLSRTKRSIAIYIQLIQFAIVKPKKIVTRYKLIPT